MQLLKDKPKQEQSDAVYSAVVLCAALYGAAYTFALEPVKLFLSLAVIAAVLLLPGEQAVYVAFFCFPYAAALKIGGTYFFIYLLAILLLRALVIGRQRIGVQLILILFMIAALELLGFWRSENTGYFQELIKLLCAVGFAGHFLVNRPTGYRHQTAMKYFLTGMLIESLTNIATITTKIAATTYYGIAVDRQAVLGQDPNAGALFCLTAIWICLAELAQTRRNQLSLTMAAVCMMICGVFSQSKTYLMLMVPTLICFLLLSITSFKRFLVASGGVLLAVSAYLINPITQSVAASYLARLRYGHSLQSFTTGRTLVYSAYLKHFLTNLRTFFIGDGLLTAQLSFLAKDIGVTSGGIYIRPHSMAIEFLVGWGLLGTIIFLLFWIRIYHVATARYNLGAQGVWRWMPLLVFLVFSMTINIAYQSIGYVLLLICLYYAMEPFSPREA